MSVLQWNLNGLRRHLADLKLLIHEYSFKILALQETHALPDKQIVIPKCLAFRCDYMMGGKASGGVAIFVSDDVYC